MHLKKKVYLEDNTMKLVEVVDMEVEDKLMLVDMVGEDRQMVVVLSIGMVDNLLNQGGMKNREMWLGRPNCLGREMRLDRLNWLGREMRQGRLNCLGREMRLGRLNWLGIQELGVQVEFHMVVLTEHSLMQVSAIVQYNS